MNSVARATSTDRSFVLFQQATAGATLVMVSLSWPLWINDGSFPQVPFVVGWVEPGRWIAAGRFVVLVGALGSIFINWNRSWAWSVSLSCFIWSILGDQNRLQPWVQHFAFVAMALLICRPERAMCLARWYAVVLYAASGLSKVDAAFVNELGSRFLRQFGQLVDFDPGSWPASARFAAILAMPLGEILIAIALVMPSIRLGGLAGSIVQHLITIAILGPWGLNHSTIVLVWNGAMIAENLALFGGSQWKWVPSGGNVLTIGLLVVVLVGCERWGLIDSWPAHALYASHAEQATIDWPDADAVSLPSAIQQWLRPPDADGFRRLDLTGWSRAVRGVPVYPQNRVVCGIVEALLTRVAAPSSSPIRVVLLGRAGSTSNFSRIQSECINLSAIHHHADRYFLNANPSPGFDCSHPD